MSYWLLCLSREDIEHCMRRKTFGLNRKFILGRVKKGDKVICCAGKGDWKIIGAGTCTSDYYVDDTPVFLQEGIFPDRFHFESQKLGSKEELDIMSVIDQLSFVKNIGYWSVFFRNGIAEMSQRDWDLIQKKIGQHPASKA